jgi:hypothetical protein
MQSLVRFLKGDTGATVTIVIAIGISVAMIVAVQPPRHDHLYQGSAALTPAPAARLGGSPKRGKAASVGDLTARADSAPAY